MSAMHRLYAIAVRTEWVSVARWFSADGPAQSNRAAPSICAHRPPPDLISRAIAMAETLIGRRDCWPQGQTQKGRRWPDADHNGRSSELGRPRGAPR